MNRCHLITLAGCLDVAARNPRRGEGEPAPWVSSSSISYQRDERHGEVLEATIRSGCALGGSEVVWIDEGGRLLTLADEHDEALVPGYLRWVVVPADQFCGHVRTRLRCEPVEAVAA